MALQQDPRNEIYYDWDQGEGGWKANMDANLRYLGSMLNLAAIDFENNPPASPSNGDTYIVGTAGTGDWSGQDNDIAIWFNDDTLWRFFTPTTGMTCFITTGSSANQLRAFNGTSWSTNGFTFTF